MKKLTTSLFTVLLGVVAFDASAAVTSKAYVDGKVKVVDDKVGSLETTVNQFTTNIGDTITEQIKEELTSDTSEISKALADKADKATTLAGYGITDAMTSTAITGAISTAKTEAIEAAATAGNTAYAVKATEGVANTASTNASTALSNIGTLTGLTTTAKDNVVAAINDVNANKVTAEQVTTAITNAITQDNGAIKDAIDTAVAGKADKTQVATDIAAAVKVETDRATEAEKAITDTIGEVAENKTVVEMIADAKTAATYDDTELSGKVTANTNAITAINNSDVMKSTITAAKVTSYDNTVSAVTNVDTGLAATRTLAQKGVDDAAAAKDVADAKLAGVAEATGTGNVVTAISKDANNNVTVTMGMKAIPEPTAACTELGAKCVLTVGTSGYEWEVVERAGSEGTNP